MVMVLLLALFVMIVVGADDFENGDGGVGGDDDGVQVSESVRNLQAHEKQNV